MDPALRSLFRAAAFSAITRDGWVLAGHAGLMIRWPSHGVLTDRGGRPLAALRRGYWAIPAALDGRVHPAPLANARYPADILAVGATDDVDPTEFATIVARIARGREVHVHEGPDSAVAALRLAGLSVRRSRLGVYALSLANGLDALLRRPRRPDRILVWDGLGGVRLLHEEECVEAAASVHRFGIPGAPGPKRTGFDQLLTFLVRRGRIPDPPDPRAPGDDAARVLRDALSRGIDRLAKRRVLWRCRVRYADAAWTVAAIRVETLPRVGVQVTLALREDADPTGLPEAVDDCAVYRLFTGRGRGLLRGRDAVLHVDAQHVSVSWIETDATLARHYVARAASGAQARRTEWLWTAACMLAGGWRAQGRRVAFRWLHACGAPVPPHAFEDPDAVLMAGREDGRARTARSVARDT